ncbi:hypothetical protein LOAG_18072 [Loa loa]|nr:hypothetical protein LOAG_18072 [Loa loa]EJD74637.1 hypothetical protein LOAG_18072 [Loa loa]
MQEPALNVYLSNGNAISQGNPIIQTSVSPQVSQPQFDHFPCVSRPINPLHEQPLYQHFSETADLFQPENGWAQDYEILLDLVTTEPEDLGPNHMIRAMLVLARIMNLVANIIREDQIFNGDFLDPLQLALEQFRQNAVEYCNANEFSSVPEDQ